MRVVIVGSGSSVGRRIADVLAARTASVVGIDIVEVTHPTLTASLRADVRHGSAADAAMSQASELLGGIDVVVTATAKQLRGRLDETSDDAWEAVMSGTAGTVLTSMRAALRHLQPGGAIVVIGSVAAFRAHPGTAAYAAAKGAVSSLVTQAALEYAPRGIRINLVAPGVIDSPEASAGYPMGRTVTSDEVARAVAFLASSEASGITGAVLPVDGGLSIASPAAFVRPDLRDAWLGADGLREP